MNFSNIGVAMMRKNFTLGNSRSANLYVKAGVFFTDKSSMYIDANVIKNGNIVGAKLALLDANWQMFTLKGCNTGYDASDFISKNINNFKTNEICKVSIKMFTKFLYGRVNWEQQIK